MKEDRNKMRSEGRRVKRIEVRNSDKMCFNCRKPGHKVADCPESKNDTVRSTNVCFKCGASDHRIHECKVKVPQGKLPFALCFICKETGHISRDCSLNEKGVYPNGGCCNECGSVKHLGYNCPERKNKRKKEEDEKLTSLKLMTSTTNLEEDETYDEPTDIPKPAKKVKKVVKFWVTKMLLCSIFFFFFLVSVCNWANSRVEIKKENLESEECVSGCDVGVDILN